MDDIKLRVRKKAVQFTPPSSTTASNKVKKAKKKTVAEKSTAKSTKLASKSKPKAKVDGPKYKKEPKFKGEVVGGWFSSTRPTHLIDKTKVEKPKQPPVVKKRRKKCPSTPNPKPRKTWKSGSPSLLTVCVYDGKKKVTTQTLVNGAVVKNRVKEYWSTTLARERFEKGWNDKEEEADGKTTIFL
mmetsp:Transcript_13394/g.27338  ORF Transcript_13394/g.27338 Transcript_13394/m.27338 type:complete len:185 (-) Transcript_13394:42-596(-)